MARVREVPRSSGPFASIRAIARRVWNSTHPLRLAGVFLLLMWVGPVTFVQTDSWRLLRIAGAPVPASALPQTIPAGKAMLLEPGTLLKVHLRDGSVLNGRFLGRTLLDSALYTPRFAAHARASSYVPFTLGETLCVSLHDGREMSAPFAGYGELTLLLRSPDGSPHLRVPFEFAREIRRASGDRVEPGTLARAFRKGSLPSAEAFALAERVPAGSEGDSWAGALRVAVEDIASVSAELPSGGGNVAGVIVLSVLLSLVLVFVILHVMFADLDRGCSGPEVSVPQFLSRVRLTDRPFDRYRACFVGDPLVAADPWPATSEGAAATALAEPAATHAPAR